MTGKNLLLISSFLFIAAALLLVYLLNSPENLPALPDNRIDADIEANGQERHESIQVSDTEPLVKEEALTPKESDTIKAVLAPEGSYLTGKVIDKLSKAPGNRFTLFLHQLIEDNESPMRLISMQTVADEEGLFNIPLEQSGELTCTISTEDYVTFTEQLVIPEDGGLSDVVLELDRGLVIKGRVEEAESGLPIEDALIIPTLVNNNHLLHYHLLDPEFQFTHTRSDAGGRFDLSGIPSHEDLPVLFQNFSFLVAIHPDYPEGVLKLDPDSSHEFVFRLEKGHSIFGKVLDEASEPAGNVMVTVSNEDMPLPRPVLTGPDGNYRTPPCLPGGFTVRAGSRPDKFKLTAPYPEQFKEVHIHDKDVELNFGPFDEYATLTGTLYDAYNEPVTEGAIKLSSVTAGEMEKLLGENLYEAELDDNGQFEFNQLPLGMYDAIYYPEKFATFMALDKITLEYPGHTTKDLQLLGSEISGIVVDKHTREPINNGFRMVILRTTWHDNKMYASPIDKEGRFHFKAIPEGFYFLVTRVIGYPVKMIDKFEVQKYRNQDDIRIELIKGGVLSLELTEFDTEQRTPFNMKYMLAGNHDFIEDKNHKIGPQGQWNYKTDLEPGSYELLLDFKEAGYVFREFKVHTGETTKVAVRKDDLRVYDETMRVAGSLQFPDGSPCREFGINFYNLDAIGWVEEDNSVLAITDENGQFIEDRLKPGEYLINIFMDDGQYFRFPRIHIAVNTPQPHRLDYVIPGGMVTGTLCDAQSGKLFSDQGPEWTPHLSDMKTNDVVNQGITDQTGADLKIKFLPGGKFYLKLNAKGYKEYIKHNITLKAFKTLDLGKIYLEPAGVVMLECVDALGGPVELSSLKCNGAKVPDINYDIPSPGVYHLFRLPLGLCILELRADGHAPETFEVKLAPHEVMEMKATFE